MFSFLFYSILMIFYSAVLFLQDAESCVHMGSQVATCFIFSEYYSVENIRFVCACNRSSASATDHIFAIAKHCCGRFFVRFRLLLLFILWPIERRQSVWHNQYYKKVPILSPFASQMCIMQSLQRNELLKHIFIVGRRRSLLRTQFVPAIGEFHMCVYVYDRYEVDIRIFTEYLFTVSE